MTAEEDLVTRYSTIQYNTTQSSETRKILSTPLRSSVMFCHTAAFPNQSGSWIRETHLAVLSCTDAQRGPNSSDKFTTEVASAAVCSDRPSLSSLKSPVSSHFPQCTQNFQAGLELALQNWKLDQARSGQSGVLKKPTGFLRGDEMN